MGAQCHTTTHKKTWLQQLQGSGSSVTQALFMLRGAEGDAEPRGALSVTLLEGSNLGSGFLYALGARGPSRSPAWEREPDHQIVRRFFTVHCPGEVELGGPGTGTPSNPPDARTPTLKFHHLCLLFVTQVRLVIKVFVGLPAQ